MPKLKCVLWSNHITFRNLNLKNACACGQLDKYRQLSWWLTPVPLATWEAEVRRLAIQGQLTQKVHETPSQPIGRHSDIHLSSQTIWEVEIERITVPAQPRQESLQDLISMEKAGVAACACHPSHSDRKRKMGGSWSRPAWAKSETLAPKQPEQNGLEEWFK
jgi:hypothetical protein